MLTLSILTASPAVSDNHVEQTLATNTLAFPDSSKPEGGHLLALVRHASDLLDDSLIWRGPGAIEVSLGTGKVTFTFSLKKSDKIDTRKAHTPRAQKSSNFTAMPATQPMAEN